MEEFRNLDRDIEGSAKRWQKFAECECPEREKFPQEWKSKTSLQKLCMMRALRPDRMTYAVRWAAATFDPAWRQARVFFRVSFLSLLTWTFGKWRRSEGRDLNPAHRWLICTHRMTFPSSSPALIIHINPLPMLKDWAGLLRPQVVCGSFRDVNKPWFFYKE